MTLERTSREDGEQVHDMAEERLAKLHLACYFRECTEYFESLVEGRSDAVGGCWRISVDTTLTLYL